MDNYFLKLAPDELVIYNTALATSLSDKDASAVLYMTNSSGANFKK